LLLLLLFGWVEQSLALQLVSLYFSHLQQKHLFGKYRTIFLCRQFICMLLLRCILLLHIIIAFALSFFLFARYKSLMRKEGWILMCFVLFYLFSPLQLYTIYQDIRLSLSIFQQNIWEFYSSQIQDFFFKRVKNVVYNSLNGLAILSALTIVVYAIWQPLKDRTL